MVMSDATFLKKLRQLYAHHFGVPTRAVNAELHADKSVLLQAPSLQGQATRVVEDAQDALAAVQTLEMCHISRAHARSHLRCSVPFRVVEEVRLRMLQGIPAQQCMVGTKPPSTCRLWKAPTFPSKPPFNSWLTLQVASHCCGMPMHTWSCALALMAPGDSARG